MKKGIIALLLNWGKKSELPISVSITGTVIEVIVAEGTKSKNNYFKIRDESGDDEEYIFSEIGENYNFDELVDKKVEINGFREVGFIRWQHEEIEGIYVEEIKVR